MEFSLHPQLDKDTSTIGEFPLCLALLHYDNAVPWVILVPKIADITELHQLPMKKQQQYLSESQAVAHTLERCFEPDKLNIGMLGNIVSQLHIHHIARFKSDPVWPGPVWGNTSGQKRSDSDQQQMLKQLRTELVKFPEFVSH
ncbi:HIT family protein [Vibrio sp. SCSIO 43136]|uniref:HIT domain-containing protein n=1 Tax=Vibrio sp. SCSIO 43136 TaxID=2819101 RepID=UPI00207505CE|nr:HIT family protein [Vibrio sp. SCSIO 43136]USD64534.1 HIT family protein [Vibrio sp. SCSIO 43136]